MHENNRFLGIRSIAVCTNLGYLFELFWERWHVKQQNEAATEIKEIWISSLAFTNALQELTNLLLLIHLKRKCTTNCPFKPYCHWFFYRFFSCFFFYSRSPSYFILLVCLLFTSIHICFSFWAHFPCVCFQRNSLPHPFYFLCNNQCLFSSKAPLGRLLLLIPVQFTFSRDQVIKLILSSPYTTSSRLTRSRI